jgi:hypothetical protein
MSFVTDTWRQLVRRRLWPVALLLLAALAAVPFLLAKDPEPAAVPAVPTGAAAAGSTTLAKDSGDPIVSVAAAAGAEGSPRRRVLGSNKDPFEPAPAKKVKKASVTADSTATPDATQAPSSTGGGSSASGGSSTPSTGTTTSPVATPTPTPAPKKKTYPLYSLTVRFGDSSNGNPTRSHVTRLDALPDSDNPLLVYLGVKDGGKAAVFMLDSSVTPQGDGECEPSPATCETLILREGETEFFDVLDAEGESSAQFQLDLVDINTRHSSTRETKSLKSVKVGGSLRYRYNARKGTLRQLGLHARQTRSANAESAVVGSR